MARKTAKNAQEILMADFQTLVLDAESCWNTPRPWPVTRLKNRAQIKDSLFKARATLEETKESLKDRSQAAVVATEDYVQANPWQSVGIAAGIGFVLGLLATRR